MGIFLKHSDPNEKYKSGKRNGIGKVQSDSRVWCALTAIVILDNIPWTWLRVTSIYAAGAVLY